MNVSNLTLQHVDQLRALVQRKEQLSSELAAISATIEGLLAGAPAAAVAGPKRRGRKPKAAGASFAPAAAAPARAGAGRRGRRGSLKEAIVQSLQSAGKDGISVADLAASLGTKYGNISVWFAGTGKKIREIRKVAPARYAWVG